MTMTEMRRLIEGLRMLGLTGDEITNFLLWVESGNTENEPKSIEPKSTK